MSLRSTVTALPVEAAELVEDVPLALELVFPSSVATAELLRVEPTDVTLMK